MNSGLQIVSVMGFEPVHHPPGCENGGVVTKIRAVSHYFENPERYPFLPFSVVLAGRTKWGQVDVVFPTL